MVRVVVPATSANLGSGFDCLGLALRMFNSITVEHSEAFGISVVGQGETELLRDRGNLAYRSIRALYREIGVPVPPLHLTLANEVPLRRGLGSSATAVVGGLVAANALNGSPLDKQALLRLACQLEGHPDNVTAALHGGLVIAISAEGHIDWIKLPVAAGVRAVAFVPDFGMATAEARAALPSTISLQDAVFNASRSAMLVAALSNGRLDLLGTATQDRLHQQYRRRLFPCMDAFFEEALRAGARGAFLSGAGSTILALTDRHEDEVATAMVQVASREGISGKALVLELCNEGARVVE